MTADVVVIGGGVIGASCAAHLAGAGLRVAVVDRAPAPGDGSTARATGGFRASFATEIDVRLSLLARRRLARFADDTGVDPGFAAVGYLWLAGTGVELDALRAAHAVQIAAGAGDARLVAADDVAAIAPGVARDGLAGALWCPSDGTIRPGEVQRGYLALAERRGAVLRWGEPVVGFARDGDRIDAVITPSARIAAGLVVCAAGAWSAPIAALAGAGAGVPVVPLRRQVAITEPTGALPPSTPLTIWSGDGFHLRVRDDRVLLLHPTPGDPVDPWSTAVEPAWLDAIAARAAVRVPALAGVALDRARAWAGLYEMTPDRHPLVGAAPGCANLVLACGASGHGVMHAPALGLLVAELATGGARSLDLTPLRPSRFTEGVPIAATELL